jgi:hypothetical protein
MLIPGIVLVFTASRRASSEERPVVQSICMALCASVRTLAR